MNHDQLRAQVRSGHRPPSGGRSLWQDVGLLFSGQIVAQLANLAALIVLARWLGPDRFGTIQLAVAVGAYALVGAELGLFTHGVRAVARYDDLREVRAFAGAQTTLLTVAAVIAIAVLWPLIRLLPSAREHFLVFFLYLLAVLPQAFMQDWVCLGRGWTGIAGSARALRSLVYLGGVGALSLFATVSTTADIVLVPVVFLTSLTAGNLFVGRALRRRLGGVLWPRRLARDSLRRKLVETLPIGGGNLIRRTLYSVDLILLGALTSSSEVGTYAAVVKLGFVLIVGVEVALGALIPRLSRAWSVSLVAFRSTARRQLAVLAGIVAVVWGLGSSLGPAILTMIYGDAFVLDALVVRLLVFAYPMLALGVYFHEMQIAADRQGRALTPLLIAVALALLACLSLIPAYGGVGAAGAMLAADTVYALGEGWSARELWLLQAG